MDYILNNKANAMTSEFLISLFVAGVLSTLGCSIAYFIRRKSLRFLIAEWFMLVFSFTFMLAILTFSDGNISYKINFYAPIVIPLFSFWDVNADELSLPVDYLIVAAILLLFVGIFGGLYGQLIIELMAYNFDYAEAILIGFIGLVFCFVVLMFSLKKYRMMIAKC